MASTRTRLVAGTHTANAWIAICSFENATPPSGFVPLVPVTPVASGTGAAAMTRLSSRTYSMLSLFVAMTVSSCGNLISRTVPGSSRPL